MARKGFTLLEVLLVVVVLAILAGLAFGMMSVIESSRIRSTETRIHGLRMEIQKQTMLKGRPPAALKDLAGWEGKLVDAWDHPFEYKVDGKHFDLWSCGPDGISGTADDIRYEKN